MADKRSPFNIPVWINDGASAQPEGNFYEIAANGIFLHKTNPFWKATVAVQRVSTLENCRPSLELFLPPIPRRVVIRVARFFAWVHRQYGTEAVALLWIKENEKTYRLTVPSQQVSAGGLRYEIPNRLPGELLIGTLHSHGSMNAYHSSTDQCDERSLDGIHVTLGAFERSCEEFDISMQAAINGNRFPLAPEKMMEGITAVLKENKSFWQRETTHRKFYKLSDDIVLLPDFYQPTEEWKSNIEVLGFISRIGDFFGSEKKVADLEEAADLEILPDENQEPEGPEKGEGK